MKSLDLSRFYATNSDLPFQDRWAVMPLRASMPLAAEDIEKNWQLLQQNTQTGKKRLIYIHIPFCDTHCQFCGFYQNLLRKFDTEAYINALLNEIALEINNPALQSAPIHAVYFGGGTPSALPAGHLARVIAVLKQSLPLAPDCEITIEGRITDFDEARTDSYIAAGANRFSIGIQTFDTTIRKKLGRLASREQIIETFERIARKDSVALVCDLMFGLPGQTTHSWQTDLEIAANLPLDGVDLYALNLLSTTPLAKRVENNQLELPSVAARRDFYLQGADYLYRQGWIQLSNSHWGKTTRERNLYNLLIKRGADFFAFGSGAGGRLDGQSFMLQRELSEYYAQLKQSKKPLMMLTGKPLLGNWLYQLQAGIEQGRVDLPMLTAQSALLDPLIDQWQQSGLLVNDARCLRLTPSGRFWSSNLLQALQQILLQLNNPEQIKLQEGMMQIRKSGKADRPHATAS
ncbi:MAG: heme anaerobic degradation radical SAM methyltransferase ChuW/HutW [Snodgrassella sp.]|nr:heme anaerobic degradation radical SAM methyltransferase ChuW/HutW [Snodgrassella sp.]